MNRAAWQRLLGIGLTAWIGMSGMRGLSATRSIGEAALAPPAPAWAAGYPSRGADVDLRAGFASPPPGYGEVPFWWWTGDPLDRERLLWQIEELHRKGIAGVQVNYAHEDTEGWPTYPSEPPVFSDAWWQTWSFVAEECRKRGMGIGLSGYTLDWPNGRSLVSRTIYSAPELVGRELHLAVRRPVAEGERVSVEVSAHTVAVRAYAMSGGRIDVSRSRDPGWRGGERRVEWTAPAGGWELWVYEAVPKPGSLNPMHPMSGARVVERFFQPFEDRAVGRSSRGLNYFFHDELQFGVGNLAWTEDLPGQFRSRKGYDLFEALPGMLADIGPAGPKARLDFMDVRMQLIQERYFIPIFEWHGSRGLIYGCDQGSRGLDPGEFGDYFSAVRWYTAPGHDTPGGRADLIKGKVSSSIAQLYRRPRVWLEGYHSLGWAAAPERLMEATCENYLYGCNLLNLHGLYYSTHGGFWEWAPPCYHFRMPYWDHMGTFLKYFERLSYVLSQGVHRCDVAVLYPVGTVQAGLGGAESTALAFELGRELFGRGRDFVFIDDESVARAEVRGGALVVSEASYPVLVLPGTRAVRWSTLVKARELVRGGGRAVALGPLPEASDRAGGNDPELDALVREVFGMSARDWNAGEGVGAEAARRRANAPGGWVFPGAAVRNGGWEPALADLPRTVEGGASVRALHRRVGARDVFFVMGAVQGEWIRFRATGRPEFWDAWTGEFLPLWGVEPVPGGTRVRMPRGSPEAQLIVFVGGQPGPAVVSTDLEEIRAVAVERVGGKPRVTGWAVGPGRREAVVDTANGRRTLTGVAAAAETVALEGAWEFELKPTLDNRWGDFRLPVEEPVIGPEARIFRHHERTDVGAVPGESGFPGDGMSTAGRVTHGYGVKFLVLGPFPQDADLSALETRLAARTTIDPAVGETVGDRTYRWSPYAFSWRWGREGDPGHQGFHGLKKAVTDDFLCLGRPVDGHNETVYREEPGGRRYLVWSTVAARVGGPARVRASGWRPAAVYLNGVRVPHLEAPVSLVAGVNPILMRYEGPGRGHLVVVRTEAGTAGTRTPLAMRWYDEPGLLPFDVHGARAGVVSWFGFMAPPGLQGMEFSAVGAVRVTVDGDLVPEVSPEAVGGLGPDWRRGRAIRVQLPRARQEAVPVEVRVETEPGVRGADALPAPIRLTCGVGLAPVGDWARGTVLEAYSGGAWYRRELRVTADQLRGRARLDLGKVVATAEVRVNGQRAGIRVAPPWTFDLERWLRPGTNRLEVLVYNTLANQYLTVPTRYRGALESGLIGPVRLTYSPEVVLE